MNDVNDFIFGLFVIGLAIGIAWTSGHVVLLVCVMCRIVFKLVFKLISMLVIRLTRTKHHRKKRQLN